MANLRAAQKELTRTRLLATALELFETQGYHATTIDDIAAAAGTTRVTFYAHFPSRRDIMRSLIEELNEHLQRTESLAHGSTATTLVEAVRVGTTEAIAPWLRAQAARWPTIKPYILAATEASAIDPEIREEFRRWIDEVIADIAEGLTLADRHDPATRTYRGELAFAMLDQTALGWMRSDLGPDPEPVLDVLTEAWVKLLGIPPAA